MRYTNDHGLLVDTSTDPPTACGYIMQFAGHGAYAPDEKIEDVSTDAIKTHNELLAHALWDAMRAHGSGVLYLTRKNGEYVVTDWPNVHTVIPYRVRVSWHNFAGKNGRTDVWFNLDGATWHGVNIGDSQLLRVSRTKGK